MQPRPWPQVPETTARTARASSRKGNLAMRIRDVLGQVYADEQFTGAFGVRGKPGISPAQLMIVTVLQFTENLTDRQAAEAVRDRITWKYALGLELDDPGFDPTVLSEFRDRLVREDLVRLALEALLERLVDQGLVKSGGRVRTDSTHVLGAIRNLNRLELAGETLRAGLEALAVAHPDWLTGVIDPGWQQVYGARIDNLHLPTSQAKRAELMIAYGRDGYHLLDQVYAPSAPAWLREVPAVDVLRRVWIQQFYRDVDAATGRQEVRRREAAPDGDGLPPGHLKIISPYDLDARYSIKRDTGWGGYKVHFTETCDAPAPAADHDGGGGGDVGGRPERGEVPNLITNVATTTATVPDVAMTASIHQQLADKNLTPAEHLVDSGYPSADIIVAAARLHGITLVSPMLLDHSAQARAGAGYDQASFMIDFDAQQATCPQGATSSSWSPASQRGTDAIVVSWSNKICKPCPAKTLCTKGSRRHLSIRPREEHQALADARTQQTTDQWKTIYAARAGVEGTMRQTTHVTGIRTARYRGLPKTTLEHTIAATAINIIRLDAHWTGHPLDRTRSSHLTRLDFTTAA